MSTWTNILDLVYPVGSVYVAYNSTTPATRFGGTWTAITGRFPYFNAGTATGGNNTVTLTIDQIPAHRHNYDTTWGWDVSPGMNTGEFHVPRSGSDYSGNAAMNDWPVVGGGQAHNNMPAYQTLYAWRRTA
jgi:microcystin-dependent protein